MPKQTADKLRKEYPYYVPLDIASKLLGVSLR